MSPTEPGLYWAKVSEGFGQPKSDSFNAVVELFGEPPFFQVDALVFAAPRLVARVHGSRQGVLHASIPPDRVTFGPRITVPSPAATQPVPSGSS